MSKSPHKKYAKRRRGFMFGRFKRTSMKKTNATTQAVRMRERARRLRNKASSDSGRTLQIFRTVVSKRMIANTETTPVGAMSSPNKREGSGLKSEAVQTASGTRKAQIAMAIHSSVFPQNNAFKDVATPNLSRKNCGNNRETSIWETLKAVRAGAAEFQTDALKHMINAKPRICGRRNRRTGRFV